MNMQPCCERACRRGDRLPHILLMVLLLLGGAITRAAANESPIACITSVTPPSPRVGQPMTISGSCSYDYDGFLTRYEWTFSDRLFAKTSNQASITRTFDAPGAYDVMLRVQDQNGAWSIKRKRRFTVTAAAFTVNIVPSAGCTVTAGDGGVDVIETPNGIVCSGVTAATDPLCTEQFKNNAVASLKVAPDPGYAFTGWIVNGAHVQTAAAPLLLTTAPTLASLADFLLANTTIANIKIDCPNIAFQIVTPGTTNEMVDLEFINVNYDDDDGDGGGFADGDAIVTSDKDDPNGVTGGDNDLVELRVNITDPNATIASYRIDYDQTFLQAWTSREKAPDEIIASNAITLPVSQTSIYVEGVTPHGNTTGSPISLRALNATGEEVAQRTVTLVVANPIFAIFGGGPVEDAKNAVDKHLTEYAIDHRTTNTTPDGTSIDPYKTVPTILRGTNPHGEQVYYSVAVCIQTPQCAQLAKIALQMDGADVVFSGHANSGIGLSFAHEGEMLVRTADFFNMTGKRHDDSNPAIAGVAWAHEMSINGPMQITSVEIPETVENYMVLPEIVNQLKFPNDPDDPNDAVGAGDRFRLIKQGATPMPDIWYHYQATIVVEKHKFLLVKSGADDVPPLKYRSLMLYLCSSGRHFLETFQHGQMFYTSEDTGGDEIPREFIMRVVAGTDWPQIQDDLYKGFDRTIRYHSF